jgi:hypothetical protein
MLARVIDTDDVARSATELRDRIAEERAEAEREVADRNAKAHPDDKRATAASDGHQDSSEAPDPTTLDGLKAIHAADLESQRAARAARGKDAPPPPVTWQGATPTETNKLEETPVRRESRCPGPSDPPRSAIPRRSTVSRWAMPIAWRS